MKTRQEMIYEFMLALCPTLDDSLNSADPGSGYFPRTAQNIYDMASVLADTYLSKLG